MQRLLFYGLVGTLLISGYLLADNLARGLAVHAVPVAQETLHQQKIYAYRDWQSTGVQVHADEVIVISASGEWLYTPGEYHGPGGHPRYPAPTFYPLNGGPGGTLIGKIGVRGTPFLVGTGTTINPNDQLLLNDLQPGDLLYLRINDDILSDNQGAVAVAVTVNRAEEGTGY
ncbi:MAG: hypothetical protein KF832_17580 [Caldilineaceae bacterium]|nr:hypothetical protein [Caldilineaceae bacterium]